MTQEDRDAALGRAIRVKAEAVKTLAELRSHARHLGERFKMLGEMLLDEPESIRFGSDPPTRMKSGFQPFESFKFSDFDSQEVATLADQVRIASKEVERLKADAAQYGV